MGTGDPKPPPIHTQGAPVTLHRGVPNGGVSQGFQKRGNPFWGLCPGWHGRSSKKPHKAGGERSGRHRGVWGGVLGHLQGESWCELLQEVPGPTLGTLLG